MVRPSLLVPMLLLPLCSACASAPENSADADYYVPKVIRTGSNLPVKDYGADRVEVSKPDAGSAANYPRNCVGSRTSGVTC